MADVLSEYKDGGDDGKSKPVTPSTDEPSGLQCDSSRVCDQDHLNQEKALPSVEQQQNESENVNLHLVDARDADSMQEAIDEPGKLVDKDGIEAEVPPKKQEEICLGSGESWEAQADISQAVDPPKAENSKADCEVLCSEQNESPLNAGVSLSSKSQESPQTLKDGISEQQPTVLPDDLLRNSDTPIENCSSSVDKSQESSECLSKPVLSSTNIPSSSCLDSSNNVADDPQVKSSEVMAESLESSSHTTSSETIENEKDSPSSSMSDVCSKKVGQDVSPHQSSSPAPIAATSMDSAQQESGTSVAMSVDQNLDKVNEPHTQTAEVQCPQSSETKSMENIGNGDGADTLREESIVDNQVSSNSENNADQNEMTVKNQENSNSALLISETKLEGLPQIVATRSLSLEEDTDKESTNKENPTKMGTAPTLESEPLKPVTIGSNLQPLEEVQEASLIEDASFSADIAIIDSSADEADSIGGLVINNVIGAADGVADFQPDEVETERELTDISVSAPQLEDGNDSSDEHGPSAKRRKLEKQPNAGDKLNGANKVILKLIPVKNGHGLWDSLKLNEVLSSKGTILLQIHASKESMEVFEPDKNEQQKIDFTAIMAESKDDNNGHGLSFGSVDPEYDPLSVNTSQPDTASCERSFSHPHGRSTALQPAMPRPEFKHLQTPQQYHSKNEVLGLPPPLEFEEPQTGAGEWSGMGTHSVASKSQVSPHSPVEVVLVPHSPGPVSKVSGVKVCPKFGEQVHKADTSQMHVSSQTSLECSLCSYKATQPEVLKMHVLTHDDDNLQYECYFCHKYFHNDKDLKIHQGKVHSVYICKYCEVQHRTMRELQNHISNDHSDTSKAKESEKPNNPLKERSESADDILDVLGKDSLPLTCSICNERFFHRHLYKMHLILHLAAAKKGTNDGMEINEYENLSVDQQYHPRKEMCTDAEANQNFNKSKDPKADLRTPESSDISAPPIFVKSEKIPCEDTDTVVSGETLPPPYNFLHQPPQSASQAMFQVNPLLQALSGMEAMRMLTPDMFMNTPLQHSLFDMQQESLMHSSLTDSRSDLTTPEAIPAFCEVPVSQLSKLMPDSSNQKLLFNLAARSLAMVRQGILPQSPIVDPKSTVTVNPSEQSTSAACDVFNIAPSTSYANDSFKAQGHKVYPLFQNFSDSLLAKTKKRAVPRQVKRSSKKPKVKPVRKKTPIDAYPCDLCSEAFYSAKKLKNHKKNKHKKSFVCLACNAVYRSSQKLFRHQKQQHKGKYPCRFGCGNIFTERNGLVKHYKEVHNADYSKKTCPHCQKVFVYTSFLLNHLEKRCEKCPPDQKPSHVCGNCDGLFLTLHAYNEHDCPGLSKGGLEGQKNIKEVYKDMNDAMETTGTSGTNSMEIAEIKMESLTSQEGVQANAFSINVDTDM